VFDFSQGEKSGLITSRHTLMSLLYSKHCLATIVTVRLVKKRAVKPSNDSRLEAKGGREREREKEREPAVNQKLEEEKVVQQEAVNILMSGRTVLEPGLVCSCTVCLLYIWCQTM